MKRIIVGFEKLTPEISTLLLQKYPDGFSDDDIIAFKNANGETIQAVELKDGDTTYLVKIGKKITQMFQEFEEEDSDFDEDSEFIEENNEIDPDLDFDTD